MEHEKLAKSHEMLLSVILPNPPPPDLYQICLLYATTKVLSIDVESLHFPQNAVNTKSRSEMVMEN